MSSQDLCVCFDNDKRSIFVSKFSSTYLNRAKSNVIHHYEDMADNLYSLLGSIFDKTKMPIHVLFQHPSPSSTKKSQDDIAKASNQCFLALQSKAIVSVHYVYDHHPSIAKKCWRGNDLKELCLSQCSFHLHTRLCITEPLPACNIDDITVNHPLFGKVRRCGWASMKQGAHEMAFNVSYE